MNDATDPVGGEGALAPEELALTSAGNNPAEVEMDGRRWELPQAWAEAAALADTKSESAALVDEAGADPRLAAFEGIDWETWAAQDSESANAAWKVFTDLRASRVEAGPPAALAAQRAVELHARLARDIDGWSPELAAELSAYGQSRGFTADELAAVEDPREIKILHLAMLGEQALAEQAGRNRFGGFRPPTTVGGRGHPGHLPNDRSSTDAWMQARRNQLRKKARG